MTNFDIPRFLQREGPCLSSVIVAAMALKGISAEAARQRISRERGDVLRLHDVHFPNREKFIFLREQYRSPEFACKLSDALTSTNSAYTNVIFGLQARGGAVLKGVAPSATGLAVTKARGHILHETAVERLIEHRLLRESATPDGDELLMIAGDDFSSHDRAVFQVEQILLGALAPWLGKIGLASPGKIKLRTEQDAPTFGQFAWDFVAPSYLNAIVSYKAGQVNPGFIAGDIILSHNVTSKSIRPFLYKWDAIRAQRRSNRLQPVLIAKFIEPGALRELRKRGCIIGIPETIFGKDAADALLKLVATIENAAIAVVRSPEAVFELLGKVSKIEGAALNTRGILFEMLVGRLFSIQGFNIDIRKVIQTSSGDRAEIDVRAKRQDQLVCCECKGMSPGNLVGRGEIADWESRQLPRIKDWIKQSEEIPKNKRFIFWSSSDYTPEAKEVINDMKTKHKNQPVEFLTGEDLVKALIDNSDHSLVKIFREQFIDK